MSSNEMNANGQDDDVHGGLGFSTLAIHGYNPNKWPFKPMTLPLVTSTNFKYESFDKDPEYFYGRYGNPTRECLEKTVASLEGAKYGHCFSSGMSAIAAAVHLLKPGDGIICTQPVYGGTTSYFKKLGETMNLEVTIVDAAESPENVRNALKENTKMVWMEVCCNPTLKIVDIEAVAKITSVHPSKPILVVDNTFLSPYFMKPIAAGADISLHSMTKYMSGHGDVLMGCISTNNADLHKTLVKLQIDLGFVPSPFDCYLMSRSLKTLQVRMKQHASNAMAVATMLESHPAVEKALYPGLESHPQHLLAKRILSGYSGMVSFYLKGDYQQTARFLNGLKIASFATSLGSTETLICTPWTTSHMMTSEATRRADGVTETLIRMSIGLEDIEDNLNDIRQALDGSLLKKTDE